MSPHAGAAFRRVDLLFRDRGWFVRLRCQGFAEHPSLDSRWRLDTEQVEHAGQDIDDTGRDDRDPAAEKGVAAGGEPCGELERVQAAMGAAPGRVV